ncbi:MAG: hypothetical protein K0R26_1183 [Bacteroidota bacterium]|jgi:hypothetical protein|nr:hypothetical protein [Bacteroidota bacterium]
MNPKPHIITFKTPIATCWLEANMLCISSNNVTRNKENIKEHYQIVKGIVHRKVCWLLDYATCQWFDKEVTAVIDKELPDICSCIAVIAKSKCEQLSATFFRQFEDLGIPVEVCESEREARVWLKRLDNKRKGITRK